jgi:hypothetical protein
MSSDERGQPLWLWAVRLGLGALVLSLVFPGLGRSLASVAATLPGLCLFHRLTGWPCPGCGMGHAGLRLLAGDPVGAWHCHPFVFVLLAAAGIAAVLSPSRRHRWATHRATTFVAVPVFGLLVARWISVLAG